jgi:hypothetical protein
LHHDEAIQRLFPARSVYRRPESAQARKIIDPQTHRQAMSRQRTRQPPAHAGITKIIDDPTENIR